VSLAKKFIRQHIQNMSAYEPIYPLDVLADELGIAVDELIKLDANENPYGALPEVKQALAELDLLHIYPDPESRRIRKLLADHHAISEDNIVLGAGADELIDLITRIVIEPGDTLLNCPPTFGMYAFDGALNHARMVDVPRKADFSVDIDAVEKTVEDCNAKVLFLAHPNNPDGGVLSRHDFLRLVDLPILLVMDEAYIQFSDRRTSFLEEVLHHENVIVLRTFSKWAGLAGMRIGYGIFPEDFVPILMRAKQPYNVSAAAEEAALVTMRNLEKAENNIEKIIEQREYLHEALQQISWLIPYPSQANFILCRVERYKAREVKDYLRYQGILIRYFNKPGLDDHIRISIGSYQQIQKLLTALKGFK
jgi:histidinol-phosphate aminotransferase